MNMTLKQVWAFARRLDKEFKPTEMRNIKGKMRPIDAPFQSAKKKLRLLHRWFQRSRLYHRIAHGAINGRSCFTSARRHLGHKYVWTRDAKDCYPSISTNEFRAELRRLGFRHDTALLLGRLCTVRGRFGQGSPVSGDALNIYFWRLDQAVSSRCGKLLHASRVADDFVVSGNRKILGDALIRRLEEMIEERGININEKKRRKSGFQDRSAPQLVHNIRVENRRGTKIFRDHWNAARQCASSYIDSSRSVQPDSLEAVAAKRLRLLGYIYYMRQADFANVKHLKQQLKLGDRKVAGRIRAGRITAYKNKWWLKSKKRNEPRRIATVWRGRIAGHGTQKSTVLSGEQLDVPNTLHTGAGASQRGFKTSPV